MSLDAKGRCCGRKPLLYKRRASIMCPDPPYLYCPRCDRAFNASSSGHEQLENFLWVKGENGIFRKRQYP